MNRFSRILTAAAFAAGLASAQRADVVLNNYSLTDPNMPNYGIAQGSIFIVKGAGLGPVQTPTLPDLSKGDLQTNLSGVTVTVTMNGQQYPVPLYYVFDQQIAGVLPSNTPVGTGTVTVSFNGKTTTSPIKVVPAAFGIDTFTGNGTGVVVAQNYSNLDANKLPTLVTQTAAANPGDTLVLWGSGLGPSPSGTNDAHYPMPQVDMKANVKVFIGGQQAQVAYAGRSAFPGLDQINVTVPQGITGCSVSVVVQTGNSVSNVGSLPIASSGRTCSDVSTTGLNSTDLQALISKPSARIGFLSVSKNTTQSAAITIGGFTSPATTTTNDSATGIFEEFNTAQLAAAGSFSINQTSLGSCTAFQFKGNASSIPQVGSPKLLDAGTITLKLPDGTTKNLTRQSGIYSLSGSDATGSTSPLFLPAAGGQFSFTNTGGADVGTISGAQITMPPAIVWTNMSTISTVDRTKDLPVNWDKTNPYSGYVSISGVSFAVSGADTSNAVVTGFTCIAPYSAGTFTVPSYILLQLVPSTSFQGIALPGSLGISLNAAPVKFNAPTLDYAIVTSSTSSGKSVTYQ